MAITEVNSSTFLSDTINLIRDKLKTNITDPIGNISDNIILKYRLDDNLSTTNVIDSIGTNNGTLSGGDNTEDKNTSGVINDAFDFNGTDDYISASFVPSVKSDSNHSVSMWIKSGDSGENSSILFSNSDSSANRLGISCFNNASDVTVNSFYFTGTGYSGKSGSANYDEWIHIVHTCSSSSEVNLYINGILQVGTTTDAISFGNGLWIGAKGDSSHFYKGKLDDIRIYDKVLTQTEVSFLFNKRPIYEKFCLTSYPRRAVTYPIITVTDRGIIQPQRLGMASEGTVLTMNVEIRVWARNVKERDELFQQVYQYLRTNQLDATTGLSDSNLHDFSLLSAVNVDEEGEQGIKSKVMEFKFLVVIN